MAIGDAAAAAGLTVYPATQDPRLGYQNDNQRGDELAAHMTTGGHPVERISGLTATKIPTSTGSNVQQDLTFLGSRIDGLTATRIATSTGSNVQQDLTFLGQRIDGLRSDTIQRPAGYGTIEAALLALDGKSSAAEKVTATAYGRQAGNNRFAMYMDDQLNIGRATSSRRYKEDIESAGIDPAAVLALEPVRYHHKATAPGERELGLIAEDVHATGLEDLVTTFDGQIDGVRYDLVAVALLAVVKDQAAQLAALTARVETMEADRAAGQ